MEDIMPVDYTSRAIAYLSRQQASLGKAFHLVNPHILHSKILLNVIHSFGYPLQQISYDQWRAKLMNIASSSPEHPLYPLVPFFSARKSQEKTSNSAILKFDCQNTLDGLAGTSIVCPAIDEQLLSTYVSYLIKSGFLTPPQSATLEVQPSS
jgi:thioester reductase-like protein